MAEPKEEEIIRLVRVLEYIGPRSFIENTLSRSKVQGTIVFKNGARINGAVVGSFPEILKDNGDGEQWMKN